MRDVGMEIFGFNEAVYRFITGKADYVHPWKENIHTPILDYYFKSVAMEAYDYFSIKRRRKQIGLN